MTGQDRYDEYGFDANGFRQDGYNMFDRDANGYDRLGFNTAGCNKNGFGRNGYNTNGFDANNHERGRHGRTFQREELPSDASYAAYLRTEAANYQYDAMHPATYYCNDGDDNCPGKHATPDGTCY